MWRRVAEVLVGGRGVGGWEEVVLAALSVPGAGGWLDTWKKDGGRGDRTSLTPCCSTSGE